MKDQKLDGRRTIHGQEPSPEAGERKEPALQQEQLVKELRRARRQVRALRRQVEAERRRAKGLGTVIEDMTEGISITNPEGRVLRINRVSRAILGIQRRPKGYGLVQDYYKTFDLRYPDGRPLSAEEWPPYRALRGETFTDMEVILTRPDGKRFALLFGGSPVRDEAGNIILGVNVWRDVTALRELELARREVLDLVAHDLRAPLAIVLGHAQVIEGAVKTGKTNRILRSAEAIVGSARLMNSMISDLLDLARLEARQLRLRKRPVDLKSLVHDMLERAALALDTGRVKVEIPENLPPVKADPDRVERILMNLLTNALKYSPTDTGILITARRAGEEVVTSVIDRGLGISPEDLPHVFERFYRAKGARKAQGLGLGLYITKMLVEAQGGYIWIESEIGTGSTFSFALPIANAG